MIYLDTSVALAQLLSETRRPPARLWSGPLVSSRLLQYEVWTRLHALGLGRSHGELAEQLLARIGFVELVRPAMERALQPFPVPVRTLDALHLAALDYLRQLDQQVELATYDERMASAGRALGVGLVELEQEAGEDG